MVKVADETPAIEQPKKYELVDDLRYPRPTAPDGSVIKAYRIRALIDIPLHNVKAGDLGGFVEDGKILSHSGSCWVGGDALVLRPFETYHYWDEKPPLKTVVQHDALVTDNAFTKAFISGSAVIMDHAVAIGRVQGDGTVMKDNARLAEGFLSGNVVISENAIINHAKIVGGYLEGSHTVHIGGCISITNSPDAELFISVQAKEKISIKGAGKFNNVTIEGDFTFDAEVNLEGVSFQGDNTILGTPRIKPDVKFTGRNVLSGDALIPPGSHVHDVQMSSGVLEYGHVLSSGMATQQAHTDQTSPLIASTPLRVLENAGSNDLRKYTAVIDQIEAEYEAYTTDVVKLIKYPGMVDTSIPEVGQFVLKLRVAKRSIKTAQVEELAVLSETLELAFLNAENRVQTLAASHLDENKKKSLKTAEKMFSIACDEASPEPEKRLGYKAGMRALEGIVRVSDAAKDNMRSRIGILELEA